MITLTTSDGSSMFMCQVDDNLNLDEFETSYADENSEQISVADLEIHNFATNIVGEHDCHLDGGHLPQTNIKMIVTKEANKESNVNINSQFKAELHAQAPIATTIDLNEKIQIQCPKSGKFVCNGENQLNRPSFVIEPFDINAFEGTTIELPCQGDGDPEPDVKWKKDGKTLVESAKHRIAPSGSLFIKKITIQEAGRYECTIRNSFGRISASALVTVK